MANLAGKSQEGEQMDEMPVFKSYLRKLMQDLKDVEKAADEKNEEKVKALLKQLIDDTQKDLED